MSLGDILRKKDPLVFIVCFGLSGRKEDGKMETATLEERQKSNWSIKQNNNYNKFNSASVLHIPIEHADDVNKLFVIPRVVVSLAILSLLSASITQQ